MSLLDLPTELRLSIYELLLGGRTIHIGDPLYPASTDQDGFFLCEATVADMDLRSRDIQSIAETNHRKYWRTPDHPTIQPPLRGTLPRLSNLSLYLETCPADLGASSGHFHVGRTAANAGINAPGELDEVFGVAQELATESLKEVSVNVVDTTWLDEYRKGHSACADLDEKVVEEWTASMKRRMLETGTAPKV
ncbi:hypothetical protein D0860_03133 [Hortaea werneckii]|uniref:Uncharacterized protein n=1 Tax=Hortaea werneckii TaxID=91943 RepID=A0A3M7HFU9_HORWE|nr:hypothetical protein D0860_03133 [Hortaea werneckii]